MFKYQNKNYTYYHNNVVEMQKCVNDADSPESEHKSLLSVCDITVSNLTNSIIPRNSLNTDVVALLDSLLEHKIECQLTRNNLRTPEPCDGVKDVALPGIDYYEPLEIVEDAPETYGITESKDEWVKFQYEFNSLFKRAELKFLGDVAFTVTPYKYMLAPTACDNGVVLMAKTKKFDSLDALVKSMPCTNWYLYDVYQDDTTKNYFVRYAVCLS